jgi:hypothetical protein
MPGSWDPNDFPNLVASNHALTSVYDTRYNCIAWAANDTSAWWEPFNGPGIYWPPGAPTDYSIWAYAAAFATLGYVECQTPTFEDGWEKIALYAELVHGEILATHAARQLADGTWTSKLGDLEDISHADLDALCGRAYGADVMYMKRVRV